MPLVTSYSPLRPIRIVSAVSCLVICWPSFAQNQARAGTEIQSCIKTAGFNPDTFVGAKDTFVNARVRKFVGCLNTTTDPKDPEVEYWLGVAYKFETVSTNGWMENSRAAFCSAAAKGYVLAQEECALASFEDKKAQYRWTLAAALNGSASAQGNVSTGAWGNAANRDELEYNNYLVNYLGCHPAMFKEQCSWAQDSKANAECHQYMREAAAKAVANLAQCQKDLNNSYTDTTESNLLADWKRRASEQLVTTLENIRQQVRRYPGLAHLQAIDP